MTDNVQLFNPNDGVTGRDGGPYLDQVEAVRAEQIRAAKEGREPDLVNPPATAGIPLNTARQQLYTLEVNNLPSQSNRNVNDGEVFLRASAASEDTLLQAHSEVPREMVSGADTEGVLPGGLMDTNPAAIATGPFAEGEGGSNHGPLDNPAREIKDLPPAKQAAARKRAAKKTASAAKRAAKKAVPQEVASAASSGANNAG